MEVLIGIIVIFKRKVMKSRKKKVAETTFRGKKLLVLIFCYNFTYFRTCLK